MRLTELFEAIEPRKVLVVQPGGYHPFTPGHLSMYKFLKNTFPSADIFVASSNNTKERPFPFKEKQFLATQAGIPANRFVEVQSPYKAMEITKNYDPNNTVLIFALSEKDKDRLGNHIKKDGTPSYMQAYPGSVDQCEPFSKHGYYIIAPTIKFSVLGQPISSASQIREMYKSASMLGKVKIIKDLYPASKNVQKVKKILDSVLVSQPITESKIFPPRPIDDNGWVTPDGKFIRVKPHHHMDAIRIYGMRGYGDAYDKGWIRIEIDPNNHTGYIQTDEDFGQCKNSILRIIKRMEQDVFRIIVYTGEGSFEWNGSDLIKLSNKMYEHIVKLKSGKYRLLSHKGKNLGTFDSHAAAAKHEGEVLYFKGLKESPDFGYSQYNKKDSIIKRKKFNYTPYANGFEFTMHDDPGTFIRCFDFGTINQKSFDFATPYRVEPKTITVSKAYITPEWRGTGVGQMMYDMAIKKAKELGYKYFSSSDNRTINGTAAWEKRLSKRYPVETVPVPQNKSHRWLSDEEYRIDLSKV